MISVSPNVAIIVECSNKAHNLQSVVESLCSIYEELITSIEAAHMLGVTRARISKMVQDGLLTGVSGLSTNFILKADVDTRLAYIAEYGKPRRGKGRK